MANSHARRLRKILTKHEEILWKELRELRQCGYHFRKQAPIDDYVVDFVCYSQRLIIEVDGAQHMNAKGKAADRARDAHLTWQGFKVLRFTNSDVADALDGVMLEILHELGEVGRDDATF